MFPAGINNLAFKLAWLKSLALSHIYVTAAAGVITLGAAGGAGWFGATHLHAKNGGVGPDTAAAQNGTSYTNSGGSYGSSGNKSGSKSSKSGSSKKSSSKSSSSSGSSNGSSGSGSSGGSSGGGSSGGGENSGGGGGSSNYIKGYYDQGSNQATDWSSYKQYGFNLVIAGINTTFLSQLKADGATAWVQPNVWQGCSYEYSQSQALTWAQEAVATGAVSGFYVADEPSTSGCPTAPSQIASWTAALHSNFPGIPTIIATYDSGDLADFAGSADEFALDTYPCQYGNGCNYSWITQLAAAADSLGLKYVGVPQAFGGDGHYDLPTAAQLKEIIDTWRSTKEIGYVIYAFSAVGMPSSDWVQNQPSLLSVIQDENAL